MPSYAPTSVRSADGHVSGLYRNAFQTPVDEYGRRWMCESVNSAIKRISGGTLRSLDKIHSSPRPPSRSPPTPSRFSALAVEAEFLD